jgi:ABC-type bacteriocin/lantibiotic exporter with double-glycine peptidase domain
LENSFCQADFLLTTWCKMLLLQKFKLILSLLDARDQRKLVLIGLVSVINGLFSVAGIASVLPFIGLLSEPELLDTNKYILMFKQITGLESYAAVVVAFGGVSLFLVVVGNLISAFDMLYGEKFGYEKEHVFSKRLLHNYLHTDVLEFEKRKTSERAKEILSDVDRVVVSTMFAMFDLLSDILVSVFVMGLLLWVDWGVTLVVITVLIGVNLLIHKFTSTRLEDLGKEFARLESDLYSDVLDSLKLQKEIKLNGISSFFVTHYSDSFLRMTRNRIKHTIIETIPEYMLEALAYGVILLTAIYFGVVSNSTSAPITLVGMYAFAAYRLMPMIGSIFSGAEGIWFGSAILEDFVKTFRIEEENEDEVADAIVARESIGLSNMAFRYSPDSAFHLEALSLNFPVGKMSCIMGKTGCGKSTVLNLMAGLYQPAVGDILADGNRIDAYGSKAWKRQIGYVPATVNIIQASLNENIALGVPLEEIDRERVQAASELVDLHSHVLDLKKGYESVYGADGLSFSSGQIQKVGLARALYRNPALLLLDESTDAFDLKTERLVLDRLKGIEGMTILFVSHRPSIMDLADQVIDLEDVLVETYN